MRILLIEDEHKIANALKQGLSQDGFAVDVEHDSDSGLAAAEAEPYDVLVIDRMLPGSMEGVDIVRALREQQIHTPVLLLTARDAIRDRVEGLNAGADDYLPKPFAYQELLARVRALLRRPQEAQDTTLTFGELSLDTTGYTAKREGKPLALSRREFSLLEYLMRHPQQTITKDRLIAHVWDFDADILPNTVEVYIGYLRNKIDKPFRGKSELIQTVRGYGYRLGDPQ